MRRPPGTYVAERTSQGTTSCVLSSFACRLSSSSRFPSIRPHQNRSFPSPFSIILFPSLFHSSGPFLSLPQIFFFSISILFSFVFSPHFSGPSFLTPHPSFFFPFLSISHPSSIPFDVSFPYISSFPHVFSFSPFLITLSSRLSIALPPLRPSGQPVGVRVFASENNS